MTEPETSRPRGTSASASAMAIVLILIGLAAFLVLSSPLRYVVGTVCLVGLIACVATIARSSSTTPGSTSGNGR